LPALPSGSLIARSRELQKATSFSTRSGSPSRASNAEDLLDVVLHLVEAAIGPPWPNTRVRAASATYIVDCRVRTFRA
jgi:hypothetical protein